MRTHPAAALVFAGLLAITIAFQIATGAYRVERGLYSDDAAHFMTGLLVRDYLVSGFDENPRAFAETYYLSYPKIAPLMWPPLFHVVLGVAFLPGWPPFAAALALVGLITAWLAWRLYMIVRVIAGPLAAAVAVGLLLTTPIVHAMMNVVMLDLAVAALSLEAVYWLARYAGSARTRDAVLFGVCVAGACLTKGNGVALIAAPVVFMAVTRRLDLLRQRGLYVAAAIVVVFAMPLLTISARFDAAIGDFGPVTPAVVAERTRFYGRVLWMQLGAVVAVLAAAGMVIAIVRAGARKEAERDYLLAALVSLAVSGIAFHLLNPTHVTVPRYLAMVVAPLLGLAVWAIWSVVVPASGSAWRPAAAIAAVVLVMVAVPTRPRLHAMAPLGYRDVATRLAAAGELAGRRVLVVSDETGEGALVSEVAVLALHPMPAVVRGSKLLASDNWMGMGFRLRFDSPEAIMAELEALHIDHVVVDESVPVSALPYLAQIRAVAGTMSSRLIELDRRAADPGAGPRRALTLYRVATHAPGPAKPIEIEINSSIGPTLRGK